MSLTTEDEIISRLTDQGAKYYVDVDFPSSEDSLYRLKSTLPTYAQAMGAVTEWRRPNEFAQDEDYFKDNEESGKLVPGALPSGYLMSACAMLWSGGEGLIEDVFGSEPDDFKRYGIYTCRFYKNGGWKEVITDTRIPCGQDGAPKYGRGADLGEIYYPLLEKAYAKLHGTYESIAKGSIAEALVDLTGGSCDKINLKSEKVKKQVEAGFIWDELVSFITKGYVTGASLSSPSGTYQVAEEEESGGLITNLAYPFLEVREVASSTGEMQFVKLKNPWPQGGWKGDWSPSSSKWDDYPEVYAELVEGKPEDDSIFWMNFKDLCVVFSKVYVLRVFPDERNYRQYCLTGDWVGKTAGGAHKSTLAQPPPLNPSGSTVAAPETNEATSLTLAGGLKKHTKVVPAADAFWFNNPQFQIHCEKRTLAHISLMQQDRRIRSQLRENYPISFEIIRTKRILADINNAHPRVWEIDSSTDLLADSTKAAYSSHLPQREVSVADLELDPAFVYTIVPHPLQRLREGKFFVRIMANQDLLVEQTFETSSLYLPGSWDKISERDTSGGPLRIIDEKAKSFKENPKWCQNPQYLLTTTRPLTAYDDEEDAMPKHIDIKIVVRRTDSGKNKGSSGGKRTSRDDGHRKGSAMSAEKSLPTIGMVVCKAPMSDKDMKLAAQRRRQTDAKINALGQKLPTKESSLKLAKKKMMAEARAAAVEEAIPEKGGGRDYIDEDKEMTEEQLMVNPNKSGSIGKIPDRKMVISKEEWSICTDDKSTDVSALYMKQVDIAVLSDGLLIIPSMSEKSIKGGFTLEVHSDYPVKVEELPETRSKTLSGEWTESTSGGNHLCTEWKKNPKFTLKLKNTEPALVKISLSRNQKTWATQVAKDSIGTMMGFYIMNSSKIVRDMDFIYHDGKPWTETPFVPLNDVSTPESFMLPPLPDDESYCIMPTTFDSGMKGAFFLSVVTESDFSLYPQSSSKKDDSKSGGLGALGGSSRRATNMGRK